MGNKSIGKGEDKLVIKKGKSFNLFLYSNTSARRNYKIINMDELKDFLKLVKSKSKYLGGPGVCGASNEDIYIFKAIKEGNIIIKVNFYFDDDEKSGDISEYNITII